MLKLIESQKEKAALQRDLRRTLEQKLKPQGKRGIGYPGGNFDRPVFSDGEGKIWYAFTPQPDVPVKRYWNAFGIFDPRSVNQNITVEINIPTDTNSQRTAGFFARDTNSDRIFLFHSGKIGGGRQGIGKNAFLAWSHYRLYTVLDSKGAERFGIIIGELNSRP